MGLISNWTWRKQCREKFAKAVLKVHLSRPFAGLGKNIGLAILPILRDVKEELYYREVLLNRKSGKILEKEFKRAVDKYVLNKQPFYKRYPGVTEWILAIVAVLLLVSSAVIHIILFIIVLILLVVGLIILGVKGYVK